MKSSISSGSHNILFEQNLILKIKQKARSSAAGLVKIYD